jgi:hypothetical protein
MAMGVFGSSGKRHDIHGMLGIRRHGHNEMIVVAKYAHF